MSKFLMLTDTHLRDDNVELVVDTCREAARVAKARGCKFIVHGGDWLDSRRGATIATIKGLRACVDALAVMPVVSVAGNHDKQDLTAPASFVSAIVGEREGWHHRERPGTVEVGGVSLALYPYFPERDYPGANVGGDIAVCHLALEGVRNKGHESRSPMSPDAFGNRYGLTLVGHYHDRQALRPNVLYVGSAYQANFGEDANKGFAVVDANDYTVEYIANPHSPKYVTHVVEVAGGDVEWPEVAEGELTRVKLRGTAAALSQVREVPGVKVVHEVVAGAASDDEVRLDFTVDQVADDYRDYCAEKQIAPGSQMYKVGEKIVIGKRG